MTTLRRIELHILDGGVIELAALRSRFPHVEIERVASLPGDAIVDEQWRAETFDFWAFDRRLDELAARCGSLAIAAHAEHALAIVREILVRGQRLALRRNAATEGAWFDRVLAEHRALHDTEKPLVRADLDHALDAWQWLLRLDPGATAAGQLATLLHDLERLASEPDRRVEHRAVDYQAFKGAHARAGARAAHALLERAGVAPALADEVAALVAVHERVSDDATLRAINDADALSFFSLNSPGYLAYFGAEQTAKKVAYTLARMSAAARRELDHIRVPSEIWLQIRRGH